MSVVSSLLTYAWVARSIACRIVQIHRTVHGHLVLDTHGDHKARTRIYDTR